MSGSAKLPLLRRCISAVWMCWMYFVMASAPAGCASSEGPELLVVDAGRYQAAFDAAVEAVRRQGMPPVLQDRRAGVIETEARLSGSVLEPWRNDNASFDQAVENTLTMQRRRARFEFAPAGASATAPAEHPGVGPSVAIPLQPPIDLTEHTGSLELRVRVFIDRAYTPGVRHSTWSRAETTTAQLVIPEGQTAGTYWVPVTRDVAFEKRLLAAVQDAIAASQGPNDSPAR